VTDGTTAHHDEILGLLPDYVVGALDDGDLWRVAAHLDTCNNCQQELSTLLETVVLLAEAPVPSPAVKAAVLARIPGAATRFAPQLEPVARPVMTVRRFPAAALIPLALAAVILLLVAGYAAWALVLDNEPSDADLVAALVLDPDSARAINDSELDVGAGGAMFVEDESNMAFIVASGLPIPGVDEQYQVWLFTEFGDRVSAGFVPVDPEGVGRAVVRAPEEFAAYWAVGVSLEPAGGSDAPTSPLVVGGWLR